MTNTLLRVTAVNKETSIFIDEVDRIRILKGLFFSYYAESADKTILDNNRTWTEKLPLMVQLFPDCKFVCCVRPPAWIMDSIEKFLRKSPTSLNGMFDFEPGMNVYDRADQLAGNDGLIGNPLNALREAYYGPFASRLMLVEYDALVSNPASTVAAVYDWLAEPRYTHDFENIEQIPRSDKFDERLGAPGLHEVGTKVKRQPRMHSLPPDLFARFAAPFWRHPPKGRAKVILEN
jgi:sulfotransferase